MELLGDSLNCCFCLCSGSWRITETIPVRKGWGLLFLKNLFDDIQCEQINFLKYMAIDTYIQIF